jgi:Ni,Fe-hydrogenase III small subunit/ferredoxin
MLEWIARGLHIGSVTTRYPRGPHPAPAGFRGAVEVLEARDPEPGIERVCPTGAIAAPNGTLTLDRGRCILCGACVERAPERFAFASRYETASRSRAALVSGGDADADVSGLRRAIGERVGALRRSIHVRHVDAGSDGAEEWEIAALQGPYYDVGRLGIFFTSAPRHADVLLVTGGVTEPMRKPLERAFEVMPEPRAVVAAGTDACSGGLSTAGGVHEVLPVDVYVPGSPPSPIALLHGVLLAIGVLGEAPSPPSTVGPGTKPPGGGTPWA